MRFKDTMRIAAAAACLFAFVAPAQEPAPSEESLAKGHAREAAYSPWANRNFPTRVLWGDTHLHTALSFDAGAFGVRLTPDDAYRFAKGERVVSSTGQPVKLSKPLDFLVVADHSDNMGFFPLLLAGDPRIVNNPQGKRWHEMVSAGGQEAVKAASEMIEAFTFGKIPKEIMSLPGTGPYRSTWETLIQSAEKANDPGRFTAMIGYEWTSTTGGNGSVEMARPLRGEDRRTDPGDRPQRQPEQRHHVSRQQGVRQTPGQGIRRDPRPLGTHLRNHADQGRR